MAFDAYLMIDGVTGESTSKGFEKQTEIFSFSLGVSNTATIGSGSGGAGSGRASFSSFNLMKKTDKASADLFSHCASGKHFGKAVVTLRKSGGDKPVNFLVYEFEDCAIESVQWSGSSGGDDTPTESVSIAFGKFTISYTPQDAKGGGGGAIVQSWSVKTHDKA
jgi:type VI secretion system secreted protein Hcp